MGKNKHGGRMTNHIPTTTMPKRGNKELLLNCRLDHPAIPPACQPSRTKVHGAKRHCSLVYTYIGVQMCEYNIHI
eukprot:3313485-Pyramimonas_sp.AAC.1